MFTFLTIVIVIAAILLCIVVLLQNGKGDGMASNFVSANQTLGVRQTADILEKLSWYLVAFILVFSVVTSIATTRKATTGVDISDMVEQAAPEFPSSPVEQAAPAAEEAPAAETPAN